MAHRFSNVQQYVSHVMKKPVYAICEQQRRRSACATTEQASLKHTWSEILKTGFLVTRLIYPNQTSAFVLCVYTNIHTTMLTMYYIRLLLYDIVTVTLRFSHGLSMKSIGYNTMCTGSHLIWLHNCINTAHNVNNTLYREKSGLNHRATVIIS